MVQVFKKHSIFIGFLLLLLSAVCYLLAMFIKSYIVESRCDPDWSSNVLYDSGPVLLSTNVIKIEVFHSNKNCGKEQGYEELMKMKPVITLESGDRIAEFLNNAHTFVSAFKFATLNNIDVDRPADTFHILLWKKDGSAWGYGRLLVFRKGGHEYGVLKAADGTGDYRYNSKLLPYIEQLQK